MLLFYLFGKNKHLDFLHVSNREENLFEIYFIKKRGINEKLETGQILQIGLPSGMGFDNKFKDTKKQKKTHYMFKIKIILGNYM